MAKVSFSKLGLRIPVNIKAVNVGNNQIEVKQYIPISEKIKFIEEVVNAAVAISEANAYKFINWPQVSIYRSIAFMKYYTNISFTDKQLEDILKLYDTFISTGAFQNIYSAIPETEKYWIDDAIDQTIDSIYKYKTSALGVMDSIGTDYKNVEFDTEKLRENLSDKDNLGLLRDVLEKMG